MIRNASVLLAALFALSVAFAACGTTDEEAPSDTRYVQIDAELRAEIATLGGRVIVGFHDRARTGDEDDIRRLGGAVGRRFRTIPAFTANLPPAARERVLDALERNPRVRFVEPDRLLSADVTPDDTWFSEMWGLHNTGQTGGTADVDIDAPEA